jgi:hypothetical protein
MRAGLLAAILMLCGLTWAAMPATAEARSPRVTLDGRPITTERAARLSCHDLVPATVRCFKTSREMEADARRVLREASLASSSVLATGYVIVYEDVGFGGASRTLAADYPDLGAIGWNDRISSFKSIGASGYFREHTPPAGFYYYFSGSSQPSSVSSYNDRFSGFQID